MRKVLLIGVAAVFAIVTGLACSIPGLPAAKSLKVTVPLNFNIFGSKLLTKNSKVSSRLILNDAATVHLSVSDQLGNQSQEFDTSIEAAATMMQTVDFELELKTDYTYKVRAEASNSAGVVLYSNETTVDLSSGEGPGSVILRLLPANFSDAVIDTAYGDEAMPSGTSTTYFVHYGSNYTSLNVGSPPGQSGVGYYFQRQDGIMLTAFENTSPGLVVTAADLGSPGTGFYMTILNQSGAPFSYSFTPTATVPPTSQVYHLSTVADSSNNQYVVGYIEGTFNQQIDVGSTSVYLPFSGRVPIVIKYDSSGNVSWFRMPGSTSGAPVGFRGGMFKDVTLDSSGNVVIAGDVYEDCDLNFGTGNIVQGLTPGWSGGTTGFVVSYDSSGNSQWTAAPSGWTGGGGPASSNFNGVAADASGNVFVVGNAWSDGATAQFFNNGSQSVTTGGNYADSPLLLKITASDGTVTKAISNETGGTNSQGHLIFRSVAVDQSTGKVFVTGIVGNLESSSYTYTHTFAMSSGSISVSSTKDSYDAYAVTSMLVAFDNNLYALWGWGGNGTPSFYSMNFNSIAVSPTTGDLYVAGTVTGNSTYIVGPSGYTIGFGGPYGSYGIGLNAVLWRFSATDGQEVDIDTFQTAPGDSVFYDVAANGGDVYVAGYIGTGTYTGAVGASVTSSFSVGASSFMGKYNESASYWTGYYSDAVPSDASSAMHSIFVTSSKIFMAGEKASGTVQLNYSAEPEYGGDGLAYAAWLP